MKQEIRTVGQRWTPRANNDHMLLQHLLEGDGQLDGMVEIRKAYEAILNHDFEQAINSFERAIQLEPNNAEYHYKLSITLARSNKLTDALQHAMIACHLNQGHEEYVSHWRHLRAKELIVQANKHLVPGNEHLSHALKLLKKATDLDPLLTEAWLLLGITYAGLNDYVQARQALQSVFRLDPEHEVAVKLAITYDNKLNK